VGAADVENFVVLLIFGFGEEAAAGDRNKLPGATVLCHLAGHGIHADVVSCGPKVRLPHCQFSVGGSD
jgi:hypothetical protein